LQALASLASCSSLERAEPRVEPVGLCVDRVGLCAKMLCLIDEAVESVVDVVTVVAAQAGQRLAQLLPSLRDSESSWE